MRSGAYCWGMFLTLSVLAAGASKLGRSTLAPDDGGGDRGARGATACRVNAFCFSAPAMPLNIRGSSMKSQTKASERSRDSSCDTWLS